MKLLLPSPGLNTRRLTWLYIIALSMVALLTVFGQIAVQRALRQLEGDAGIVNIAGRQRMLSQRLPRLVLQFQDADLTTNEDECRQELSRMLLQWETSQEALEHGSNELSLPGGNSDAIQELFRENEPHFIAVRECVRRILSSQQNALDATLSQTELRELLGQSDAFLFGMDQIVSQYAFEAKLRVEQLEWTERSLLVAMLIVLLTEGFLIFSPAVASLRRTFDQLQAVTHQLSLAKETAESANRAKTTFLTRLSHELRTPLHAILGMLSELRRTSLNPSQKRNARLTHQAARTLSSLVNDLLDVAGMETGAAPKLRFQPIQLAKLVHESVELMKPIASKKGNCILFEIESDFPKWISADPDRLRQIIYNLLQNAIRYTDEGSIQCTCRVDMSSDRQAVALEISDTGCGIAPEDQSRIFEGRGKTRIDTKQPSFGRSLGLGLPITVSLVKAMDGQLHLESESGRGTRFTVRFPLHTCEPPEQRKRNMLRRSRKEQSRGWALAVDDSQTNLILMRNYLTRLGYRTVSASNAAEAIEACRRRSPDIILLDKQLGEDDGLELIHRLRHSIPDKLPSIYLVTADIYCQSNSLSRELDIAAVLHKPLKYSELKKALVQQANKVKIDDRFSDLRTQLQQFLAQQLPIDLSKLIERYHAGDIPQVSLIVHRIRGASANAGLCEIATKCQKLEPQLTAIESDDCSKAINALAESIKAFVRTGASSINRV